jgi:hypothetical protein
MGLAYAGQMPASDFSSQLTLAKPKTQLIAKITAPEFNIPGISHSLFPYFNFLQNFQRI